MSADQATECFGSGADSPLPNGFLPSGSHQAQSVLLRVSSMLSQLPRRSLARSFPMTVIFKSPLCYASYTLYIAEDSVVEGNSLKTI